MASGFQLPQVYTRVINEVTDALLPLHRDSAGVIDDGSLTLDVIETVRNDHPHIALMVEQSALPVLSATVIGQIRPGVEVLIHGFALFATSVYRSSGVRANPGIGFAVACSCPLIFRT